MRSRFTSKGNGRGERGAGGGRPFCGGAAGPFVQGLDRHLQEYAKVRRGEGVPACPPTAIFRFRNSGMDSTMALLGRGALSSPRDPHCGPIDGDYTPGLRSGDKERDALAVNVGLAPDVTTARCSARQPSVEIRLSETQAYSYL